MKISCVKWTWHSSLILHLGMFSLWVSSANVSSHIGGHSAKHSSTFKHKHFQTNIEICNLVILLFCTESSGCSHKLNQNSYVSQVMFSQSFIHNLWILEGCSHVTSVLMGVKEELVQVGDQLRWWMDAPEETGFWNRVNFESFCGTSSPCFFS